MFYAAQRLARQDEVSASKKNEAIGNGVIP